MARCRKRFRCRWAGLKPGANTIAVRGDARATGAMVRVAVRFARGDEMIPAANSGLKVERTLSIRGKDGKWTDLASGATVPRGSYIRVRVRVEVNGGGDFPYTLVESPKPACGETVPREDVRFAKDLQIATYVLREDRDSASCFPLRDREQLGCRRVHFPDRVRGRVPPAARACRAHVSAHQPRAFDSFALKVAEGEANRESMEKWEPARSKRLLHRVRIEIGSSVIRLEHHELHISLAMPMRCATLATTPRTISIGTAYTQICTATRWHEATVDVVKSTVVFQTIISRSSLRRRGKQR